MLHCPLRAFSTTEIVTLARFSDLRRFVRRDGKLEVKGGGGSAEEL